MSETLAETFTIIKILDSNNQEVTSTQIILCVLPWNFRFYTFVLESSEQFIDPNRVLAIYYNFYPITFWGAPGSINGNQLTCTGVYFADEGDIDLKVREYLSTPIDFDIVPSPTYIGCYVKQTRKSTNQ